MIEFEIVEIEYGIDFFQVEIEFVSKNSVFKVGERKKYSFPRGDGWEFKFPDGTPKFVKRIAEMLREVEDVRRMNLDSEDVVALDEEKNKRYVVSDKIERSKRKKDVVKKDKVEV